MEGERTAKNRALWGRVGYVGEAFAAVDGTYSGVRVAPLNFMTDQDAGDSGLGRTHPATFVNLVPLMMAALWEAAFAHEIGGPLSTWMN